MASPGAGTDDSSDVATMALMVGVFDRSRPRTEARVDVLGASGAVRGNLDRALIEMDLYHRAHLGAVRLRRVRRLVMRSSHLLTFRLAGAIEALLQAVAQLDIVQRHQFGETERARASMRALAVSTDQSVQDAAADIRAVGSVGDIELLLSEIALLADRVEALEQKAAQRA